MDAAMRNAICMRYAKTSVWSILIFIAFCQLIQLSNAWPWLQIIATACSALVLIGLIAILHTEPLVGTISNTFQHYTHEGALMSNQYIPPPPAYQPTVGAQQKRRLLSLVNVKRFFVYAVGSLASLTVSFATHMNGSWTAVTLIAVLAAMVVGQLTARGIARLYRYVRQSLPQHKKLGYPTTPNTLPTSPLQYYYRERPHFSMFFNQIILQIVVWALALIGGIYFQSNASQSSLWLTILIQLWISTVNAYFIVRAYLIWNGMAYCITKEKFITLRTEDLFFWILREAYSEISKSTLVGKGMLRRSFMEWVFYHKRRTFQLLLQDAKKPVHKVPYVKYPALFLKGLSE